MSSLGQLSAQFPALVLDAASSLIQVGWLPARGDAVWESSNAEAGVGVFEAIERLAVKPADAAAFIYCEGPGSILGIRTVAMAIRAWCVLKPRPVYSYQSLAVIAHAAQRPDLSVIADARRESWHRYQVGRGLERVPTAALSGPLAMPEGFRSWSTRPSEVATVPYSLRELFPRVWDIDLFHPVQSPDAFLHEEPSYVTWTPQVHRGPKPA